MSKHYKPFLAGFIFFTHAFLCGSFAQTRFSKDEVHEKIIRVKLTEASAMKTANGISSARRLNGPISTGIEPLDQTFKQIKASEIKRVFPYAGKHEAKHRKYGLHLWYSIKYQEGKDINEVLQMFRSLDQVVVAEPVLQKQIIGYNKDAMKPANISQIYSKNGSAQPVPVNDPRLNEQWHYHNTGQSGGLAGIDIDLFEAWALETGKPNVVVSIVDGGIDINHEDLKANVWHNQAELNGTPGVDDDYNGYVDDIDGWNFTTQSAQLTPDNHGTHVAGTVGAVNNNGIGVAGIAGGGAPGTGVKLMSCQVFSHHTRPADNFAAAIVYGADNGAVISQNSWGYGGPDRFEEAVKDAIDYFTNEAGNYEGSPMRGGLVIFAAGNDDEYNTNRYPGKYEPVLAVSSIGHKGKKAYYSNYGDWVDIIAPGGETINVTHEGVLSTTINNSYAFYQGTSMACPHVSGVAALVVSKFGSPNFTGEMLRQILISSTVDINDKLDEQHAGKMGVGLIKASLALQTSGEIPPADVTDLSATESLDDQVMLSWTTPADEDNSSAYLYRIYYSKNEISSDKLAETDSVSFSAFAPAGETQTYAVKGLQPITTYYFALKAKDPWGNTSGLSNIIKTTTADVPAISLDTPQLYFGIDVSQNPSNTQNLTISNSGGAPLDWTGNIRINDIETPQGRAFIGNGNERQHQPVAQPGAIIPTGIEKPDFADKISYEDEERTYSYFGQDSSPFCSAVKFETDRPFQLTHIANYLRTERNLSSISLYVYLGGKMPNYGTLLTKQSYSINDYGSNWHYIPLLEPQKFRSGDRFWIIIEYNQDSEVYQGFTYTGEPVTDTFFYSSGKMDDRPYWAPFNGDSGNSVPMIRACSSSKANDFISLNAGKGTILPQKSQTVAVTVNSTDLPNGTYSGVITVEHNDKTKEAQVVEFLVNQTGHRIIPVFPSDAIELGDIFIDKRKEISIPISNQGAEDWIIHKATIDNRTFRIDRRFPLTIRKSSKDVNISLYTYPRQTGPVEAKLTLHTNKGEYVINITGNVFNPPVIQYPAETIHTDLSANEEKTISFTLGNTGGYPLDFSFPAFAAEQAVKNAPDSKKPTLQTPSAAPPKKGEKDKRRGSAVMLGAGFDNKHGYRWIDSDEPGGPEYTWNDISSEGTELNLSDDTQRQLNLNFEFPFYGKNKNEITISSNGHLNFSGSTDLDNSPIPNAGGLNNFIAFCWMDLNPGYGKVYYKSTAEEFIVQYDNVQAYNYSNLKITCQAVLRPSGEILFYYKDVVGDFNNCTIGIENEDGTDGAQVAFNAHYLKSEHAVWFGMRESFIKSITPFKGTIATGESANIQVKVNSAEYPTGLYNKFISLNNNSSNPVVQIPFDMAVDYPRVEIPQSINFGEIQNGTTKTEMLRISNKGAVPCTIRLTNQSDINYNEYFELTWSGDRRLEANSAMEIPVRFNPPSYSVAGWLYLSFQAESEGGSSQQFIVEVSGTSRDLPKFHLDQQSLEVSLNHGETVSKVLRFSNNGTENLQLRMPKLYWAEPASGEAESSAPSNATTTEHNPAVASGYDEYGYSWEKGAYDWIDISETGRLVTDFYSGLSEVRMPFNFPFYGSEKWRIYIGQYGFLTFNYQNDLDLSSGIPSENGLNDVIAAYYDRFRYNDGKIYYQSTPDHFIVQYQEFFEESGQVKAYPSTLQIILYPSGKIKFQYKKIHKRRWDRHIAGIENQDGTQGLLVFKNIPAWLKSESAIEIYPPAQKVLAPGESHTVSMMLNARELMDGRHEKTYPIYSNDPDNSTLDLPITLNITGQPEVSVTEETVDFGSVLWYETEASILKTYEKGLQIKNEGTKTVNLTDVRFAAGSHFFVKQTDLPLELLPNSETQLTLCFRPDGTIANYDESASLVYSEYQTASIKLKAAAEAAPSIELNKSSVEWTAINQKPLSETLQLKNTGKGTLQYRASLLKKEQITEKALDYFENEEKVHNCFIGTSPDEKPFSIATKFTAPSEGFRLTHVENTYSKLYEDKISFGISIIRGGDTPDQGTEILSQQFLDEKIAYFQTSQIALETAQIFSENETFWVVVHYKALPWNPQMAANQFRLIPGTFFLITENENGEKSMKDLHLSGERKIPYLRALQIKEKESWLSFSPLEGSAASGETLNMKLTANPGLAKNGSNSLIMTIESNDPLNPEINIPVSLHRNHTPNIFNLNASTVLETETVEEAFYVNDPDGSDNEVTVKLKEEYKGLTLKKLSANSYRLIYSTDYESSGEKSFVLMASDGNTNTREVSWPVNVIDKNRAPEVLKFKDLALKVDGSEAHYRISDYITDPDRDEITVTAFADDKEKLGILFRDNEMILYPLKSGDVRVTVIATDGRVDKPLATEFGVSIANNRNPVLAKEVKDFHMKIYAEPVTVDLAAVFSDPDNDALKYKITLSSNNVNAAVTTDGKLIITPNKPGETTVSLLANDQRGGSVSDEFKVTVDENLAPVISKAFEPLSMDLSLNTSQSFELNEYFSDPEGLELSYNINWTDKNNLLATIEEDHILALNFREVNRSEVTVTASDPYGQIISQTFEVNAKRVLNMGETSPDVTLSPNPVAEILTVNTQTELSGSFKLYGIGGRKTAEGQFENGSFTISFCDQQSGVYILKIITENSQKTFRVIKK